MPAYGKAHKFVAGDGFPGRVEDAFFTSATEEIVGVNGR